MLRGELIGLRARHEADRIQIETLSDNLPMIKAAQRAGFTQEGVLRETGRMLDGFVAETVLGPLADESVAA
jgi:RimJ/RimL family protein N-acetyltransferase